MAERFEFLCEKVLFQVVAIDVDSDSESTNDFYWHIVKLLKARIAGNWHKVNEYGFTALLEASTEPYSVFAGQLDPYEYVDILTWALRDPATNYIDLVPTGIDPKTISAFNNFVNAFIRDAVPLIHAPHWANQYVFSNIDKGVQARRRKYDLTVVYDALTNNMRSIVVQPNDIHDIISLNIAFLRKHFPMK